MPNFNNDFNFSTIICSFELINNETLSPKILKSNNINSKFYQSGIVKLPLRVNKKPPIIKIINEFF